MELIGYVPSALPEGAAFRRWLETEVPGDHAVIVATQEELCSELLRPLRDLLAVVLCPADEPDLVRLLTLRELMAGVRIILVLPTWDSDLARKGHMLGPRLVSCLESGLGEVKAVLLKIATIQGCRTKGSFGERVGLPPAERGFGTNCERKPKKERRGRRRC